MQKSCDQVCQQPDLRQGFATADNAVKQKRQVQDLFCFYKHNKFMVNLLRTFYRTFHSAKQSIPVSKVQMLGRKGREGEKREGGREKG